MYVIPRKHECKKTGKNMCSYVTERWHENAVVVDRKE